MKSNHKKWKLLSTEIQNQNKETSIKTIREFMNLSHLMGKYLDAKLSVHGLNRTQRRIIIFILLNSHSMTPTELSRLFHLTLDTINKSIDNLDKMGLTRSYRSRKDRRVRRVSLTEKGLELIEKTMPLRYQVFSEAMTCFTEKELETFFDYIQRLIDQISRLTKQDVAIAAPGMKT